MKETITPAHGDAVALAKVCYYTPEKPTWQIIRAAIFKAKLGYAYMREKRKMHPDHGEGSIMTAAYKIYGSVPGPEPRMADARYCNILSEVFAAFSAHALTQKSAITEQGIEEFMGQ